MKEKAQLYEVKLALKGRLYDTVKIRVENLEHIPKKHKVLSYKKVEK